LYQIKYVTLDKTVALSGVIISEQSTQSNIWSIAEITSEV